MKFLFLVLGLAVLPAAPAAGTNEAAAATLRRLETAHLKAVHDARLEFARRRQVLPQLGVYEDFRAVIHVHAEDAEHTRGTRREVLEAARKTGVRIVLFTDHAGPRPETWHGLRDGILFLAGEENGGAGLLRFPGFGPDRSPVPEDELRFLSHIEERYDAPGDGCAGMEISNRHTDAKLDTALQEYLKSALAKPSEWARLVADFRAYPDEVFGASSDYHPEIFSRWDRELVKRAFTGIGANDAHQNQIFLGVTFDPYEVSFRNLCTHILARDLTEPQVREALREGHAYVSHDWLCDPTGFAFGVFNNLGVFPMGDTALLAGNTRVVAYTPLDAKLKLIHDGRVVKEAYGTNLTYTAKETGAYRLEAWLTVDGEDRPWIYSNAVRIRGPSLADLRGPSPRIPPGVETRKDVEYTSGKPEDAHKHQLDLYLPANVRPAPVFFFVHGGSWRYGDRSQYPPLGNRFAGEGILTVVPSYRLAPRHPHPAQIEDVAAAFAWTVGHIAGYGGDTNRIFVGGHSAGGHLVALLALDGRILGAHGLSAANIRGVITMSGVFDLTQSDSQSSVFGKDATVRREASPLFHVRGGAPPFLVTYCEWDYPTLPAQARTFYDALRTAGVAAELLFEPHENHISEMIAATWEDDPAGRAILGLIEGGGREQKGR